MSQVATAMLWLIVMIVPICCRVDAYPEKDGLDIVLEEQKELASTTSQSSSDPSITASPNGSDTSPGVAAGIAVAVVMGTGLLASAVVYLVLRRRRQNRQRRANQGQATGTTPSPGPGIRSLDEVGSMNPLARKRSPDPPHRIRTDFANQIYQGHRTSITKVSPVTSITKYDARISVEKAFQ